MKDERWQNETWHMTIGKMTDEEMTDDGWQKETWNKTWHIPRRQYFRYNYYK